MIMEEAQGPKHSGLYGSAPLEDDMHRYASAGRGRDSGRDLVASVSYRASGHCPRERGQALVSRRGVGW